MRKHTKSPDIKSKGAMSKHSESQDIKSKGIGNQEPQSEGSKNRGAMALEKQKMTETTRPVNLQGAEPGTMPFPADHRVGAKAQIAIIQEKEWW
jgi:hypothetical protein